MANWRHVTSTTCTTTMNLQQTRVKHFTAKGMIAIIINYLLSTVGAPALR